MRKLKLQIDSLTVESFPTAEQPREEPGTVHGAAATRTGACATCNGVSCVTSCRYDDGVGGFAIAGPVCTCPVGTI
jgi:hypothetical protein